MLLVLNFLECVLKLKNRLDFLVWFLILGLSVVVNSSLTVKEPRVFRSLLLFITHHVDLH